MTCTRDGISASSSAVLMPVLVDEFSSKVSNQCERKDLDAPCWSVQSGRLIQVALLFVSARSYQSLAVASE